uniref:Uncharacterized protein n=1 Tax=Panagrellus redivivus TaxID=6233 RepID=A0A7E4V4L0_PANRE
MMIIACPVAACKNVQTPIFQVGIERLTCFDKQLYREQTILDVRKCSAYDTLNLPDSRNLVIICKSLNFPINWRQVHRPETLSTELYKINIKFLLNFKNIANIFATPNPFQRFNISMLVSKGQAEAHFAEIITVIPNLFAEAIDTCTSADIRVYARFDVQLPWKAVENLVDHHRFYTKRYLKFYRMVSQHHRNLYYVCNVYIVKNAFPYSCRLS